MMKIIDVYKLGLKLKAYAYAEWVFSMFSVVETESQLFDKAPMTIHYREDGTYAEFDNQEVKIEDAKPNTPLLTDRTPITLNKGDLPNVNETIETTAAHVLFNAIYLTDSFGGKIPYHNGKKDGTFDLGYIEDVVASMLEDGEPPEDNPQDKIFVTEYLQFTKAEAYATNFADIFSVGASPKNTTSDPKMKAYRDKRLKELGPNPSITEVTKLEEELVQMDKDWVNDYGLLYYTNPQKEFGNSRKKLHGMVGAEKDFLDPNKFSLVGKSLVEGWDLDQFATYVNSAREGSINRGVMTQLGGTEVKGIIRSTQNLKVVSQYCGTNVGLPLLVTESNKGDFIGQYALNGKGGYLLITKDNIDTMMNKIVTRSTPGGCLQPNGDFCPICVGVVNAARPEALSSSAVSVGSGYMYVFMKRMHVTSIFTTKIDKRRMFLRTHHK